MLVSLSLVPFRSKDFRIIPVIDATESEIFLLHSIDEGGEPKNFSVVKI